MWLQKYYQIRDNPGENVVEFNGVELLKAVGENQIIIEVENMYHKK